MSAKIIKPTAFGGSVSPVDDSPLFEDVASLSDHEMALTIGAVKRPALPWRALHPILREFEDPHTAESLEALREDIRRNGQRKAIAMYQGYVWDGVARYNACVALGLVPRVHILRGDPIIYLIHRHDSVRYGAPNSPERTAALAILNRIYDKEWKEKYRGTRAEWKGFARDEFRQVYKISQPCAVCALARDYSEAHHLLPLNVQYEIGIETAVQDYDWLCHVHHKMVHRLWSAYLTPTRRNEEFPDYVKYVAKPEHADKARAVFDRGFDLFKVAGGVASRGNWSMVAP